MIKGVHNYSEIGRLNKVLLHRIGPEVDGLVYIENDGRSQAGDIIRVKVLAGFVYDLAAERID